MTMAAIGRQTPPKMTSKSFSIWGGHIKHGFDVVVFSKSGAVTELRRRTDRMGSIRARFKASDTGSLLGPDGVA